MEQFIANAPKNQFQRKAYFWKQVNILLNQRGLPNLTGYKYYNARELENEYIKENKLKLKKEKEVQLARKIIQAQKEKKARAEQKVKKDIEDRLNRISQREEEIKADKDENKVIRFFNNPIANSELDIEDIPIEKVIPHMITRPNYSLLFNSGNKYWTITQDRISFISDMLTEGGYMIGLLYGTESDAEIHYDFVDIGKTRKFIWRRNGRRRPNGGYFKYYHKLDKIDLTRYGIYRNQEETDKYELNCLEIAFINAGIKKSKFDKLKTLIKTRYIPRKDLKIIAEQLKVYISLCKLDSHNNTTHYGNPQHQKINIGLIDEHYFLIEKTNYTSYSIINYFDICDKDKFNKICKKEGKKYKRREDRYINSYDLIKIILNNKETHLQEINMTNCGNFSQYSNRTFNYDDLPEINNNEAKLCEPKKLNIPRIFESKNEKKINHHLYEILYFDFEATTDEDIHKPYMICSETRNGEKKYFNGPNCALNWLQSLDKNYICIAHNLRYDFQFIVKYLSQADDMIKTGNKIKSISGKFYNKNTNKTILLHFKDSYSLISMPLREFGKCFNLDVKKEIMPYEAYNKDTVNKKYMEIKYAKQFLEENEKEDFTKNINDWNLQNGKYFNHIDYAYKYCKMDVSVLKKGYETFRGWMGEVCNLDIDNAVSIPQVANMYGLNQKVFEGCYKISGVPRDFIQKCIVGGRCMTRRNEKFKINHNVDDFDGVSLYPSAMYRMDGFLKGLPKIWNNKVKLNEVDGYFVEIEVLDIKKNRDFPLLSRKNDNGIRIFSNDIRGSRIFVDKTSLEDLIKFQEIDFRIIRGYYFNEGRNTTIKTFIKGLFDERLKKKKEKNPIQEVYKLIMNAFYGKLIMKPIEYNFNFIYGKEVFEKHLQYRFNSISQYTKITDGLFFVKEARSILDHFSMPHCGTEVLSTSKRIMNEVMCLAEDMNIEIYYQDTDSMHIDARLDSNKMSGIEKLSDAYKSIYGRELIGKHLGQFHSDFDYESEETPLSIESIYLGKKSYCDRIKVIRNGKENHIFHPRLKGIPNKCLETVAKKNYKDDIISMYDDLLNHKSIEFDLLDCCKFKFENDFTTINNKEFKRLIKF